VTIASQADLIEALALGDFDRVLGTAESSWLDFKRDPYPLSDEKGRWALASDIAAFANAQGGLLVIGYGTERRVNQGIEVASAHHPVPEKLITPQQYLDVIQGRVYPHVEGMTTRWFPPGRPSVEQGVFVIEIPPQPKETKPFLVTRMLDEEDAVHPHFVGMPRRDGDRIVWTPPATIHRQLAAFTEGGLIPSARNETNVVEAGESDEREVAAVADALDREVPWLAYQAVPRLRPHRDQYMLQQVRQAILELPPIRSSGFNFSNMRPLDWEGGEAIRMTSPRFSLRVSADGAATVSLPADSESLGWGLTAYSQMPVRVNPLALAEYTVEFCRIVSSCLVSLLRDAGFLFRIRAHGMMAGRVVLEPGPLPKTLVPWFGEAQASTDDYRSQFDAHGDAEKDAYEILLRVYALWGLDRDAVPYVDDGRISMQQIRSA